MAASDGLEAQLWDAIQRGNTADVIELLAQGADPESRNPLSQSTPLHVAAREGNVALTDILLALGANVDALDQKAYSPLQYTVYVKTSGRLAVAHRLLLANASIDVPGQTGQGLLSLTERDPDKAMFELLSAHKAIRDADNWVQRVLGALKTWLENIMAYTQTNNKERAQAALRTWLETHNIPTTGNDDDMAMLLQRAAVYRCARVIERLVNAGAAMATCFSDGLNLLAIAVRHGHDQLARTLYDRMYPSVASIAATDVCVEDHDLGWRSDYRVRKGVYKDAPVAIKQPRYAHRRNLEMLREDIKLQKMIRSPYIQPLLASVDNDPNNPTMVTEFMDQGNLSDYLRKKQQGEPVAIEVTTVQVAWVIANALLDLHRQNVVHRNVKSLKVLLSSKHGVKLSGLECAQTIDEFMTSNAGTMLWMAPEVFRIDYEYEATNGTPADIYSLGVVLTELDTGDKPYAADLAISSHRDIAARVRAGTLRPSMSPDCAPWLRELADRCLAIDPAERPTAADIVAILAPHVVDATMEMKPTTVAEVQSSAFKLYAITTTAHLCDAVRCGLVDDVIALLNDGADPNGCDSLFSRTPLHWARLRGDEAIVAHLLTAGAKEDVFEGSISIAAPL